MNKSTFLLSNIPNSTFSLSPTHLQNINQILPPSINFGGLYLGDVISTKKIDLLLKNNIKAIISCSPESPYNPIQSQYQIKYIKRIPARDTHDFNIRQFFQETFQYINQNLQSKRNVLVHCHAGISRSSTIVISYLMQKFNWNMQKSYDWVRSKRIRAKPNNNFLKQLLQFQNQKKIYNKNFDPSTSYQNQTFFNPEIINSISNYNVRINKSLFVTPQKKNSKNYDEALTKSNIILTEPYKINYHKILSDFKKQTIKYTDNIQENTILIKNKAQKNTNNNQNQRRKLSLTTVNNKRKYRKQIIKIQQEKIQQKSYFFC